MSGPFLQRLGLILAVAGPLGTAATLVTLFWHASFDGLAIAAAFLFPGTWLLLSLATMPGVLLAWLAGTFKPYR